MAKRAIIATAVFAALQTAWAADIANKSVSVTRVDEISGDRFGAGLGSSGDNVTSNTLTISISNTTEKIDSNLFGGYTADANAVGNALIVSENANITLGSRNIYGAQVKVNSTSGLYVKNNRIEIKRGATVNVGTGSNIYAAESLPSYSTTPIATEMSGNYVVIGADTYVEAQTIAAVRGQASVISDNYVTFSGTTHEKTNIYVIDTMGFKANIVSVDGARVDITSAEVGGNVYALNTGNWNPENTVKDLYVSITNSTIGGKVSAASSTSIQGTLEFTGVNTVGQITDGFGEMILNVSDANKEAAVVTVTKAGYGFDLSDKTLVINGSDSIVAGGSYKLVEFSGGGDIGFNANTKLTKQGVFVDRLWQIDGGSGAWADGLQIVSGNLMSGDLLISIGQEQANNNSKTLAESFLGSLAFVSQGAEFIADEGMRAMADVATADKVSVFGAIHGGTSSYETGSHVDVEGVTLATGAVTKVGDLMFAGYIETGWANSESHVSGTKGDGDHDYYGIGAALRYNFEGPFYIDGSARFGRASTEFNGRYANASAKYDANSLYGSIHVGAGYVFDLTEKTDLDVYGRYVLTYLEGDTTSLGTSDGEKFDMNDTVTHAFRVGTRITGTISESVGWRFGLAYEHVADGDAESDVIAPGARTSLEVPTLEGDTGIIEAGISMRSDETNPWSANIGLKGYVGDREGVAGNASIVYSF